VPGRIVDALFSAGIADRDHQYRCQRIAADCNHGSRGARSTIGRHGADGGRRACSRGRVRAVLRRAIRSTSCGGTRLRLHSALRRSRSDQRARCRRSDAYLGGDERRNELSRSPHWNRRDERSRRPQNRRAQSPGGAAWLVQQFADRRVGDRNRKPLRIHSGQLGRVAIWRRRAKAPACTWT
jgi:hypothetical protein